MWCSNCPFFDTCEDDAQLGGGCDCDGADDFGVDPIDDDYNKEFNEWWKRDITNMVKHYRNNACVMLWSSGNEVWNQVLPDGIAIVTQLQDLFHQLDPTRPVTNGMDQAMHVIHNGFGAAVELPGFNYRTGRYLEGYENLPQKMILGSEYGIQPRRI